MTEASPNKLEEVVPSFTDVAWNDFIMSQFDASEMIDGNPTIGGLRRLVEKYVGEITGVHIDICQSPCSANLNRAVATAKISIRKENGDFRQYCGAGDSCVQNTDPPYNQFPTSMAESRALIRAYKTALRFTKPTSEELSKNAEAAADFVDNDTKVTDNQIKAIEVLARKININIEKFVNAGELKYKSIKELPRNKATLVMKTLGEYQNGAKEVKQEYVGFDMNWQATFGG